MALQHFVTAVPNSVHKNLWSSSVCHVGPSYFTMAMNLKHLVRMYLCIYSVYANAMEEI
jgi:hypothetical protein